MVDLINTIIEVYGTIHFTLSHTSKKAGQITLQELISFCWLCVSQEEQLSYQLQTS